MTPVNPYQAVDVPEPPSCSGLLKRTALAFVILFVPMLVIHHSGGSSSVSVGSTVTKTTYRNYGLPKWLMKKETNGVASWSTDPINLGILTTTAASVSLLFGWLTTPRSARRGRKKRTEKAE